MNLKVHTPLVVFIGRFSHTLEERQSFDSVELVVATSSHPFSSARRETDREKVIHQPSRIISRSLTPSPHLRSCSNPTKSKVSGASSSLLSRLPRRAELTLSRSLSTDGCLVQEVEGLGGAFQNLRRNVEETIEDVLGFVALKKERARRSV